MLKTAREVLSLTDEQRAQLQRRLGEAYHKACVAFAPYETAVCGGDRGWGMFPESVLDIETLELHGMRVQNILHGRCSLAAMLDNNPIEMVETFEQDVEAYIAKLSKVEIQEVVCA
jgi:hypothetical protein